LSRLLVAIFTSAVESPNAAAQIEHPRVPYFQDLQYGRWPAFCLCPQNVHDHGFAEQAV
jgi:hypothetical protein